MEEEEYTSGIETLSRLCNEQGLEHWDNEDIELDSHMFIDKAGNVHECWDAPAGMVNVVISMTPEQAVQLGETCQLKPWEMERDTGFYDCMECACGYVADVADWTEWHYCPSCGKAVTS